MSLPTPTENEQLANSVRKSTMTGRKGKVGAMTASQQKRKSMEMDSSKMPMPVQSSMSKDGQRRPFSNYQVIESSIFLVPVMDEWVFGMTMVNASEM